MCSCPLGKLLKQVALPYTFADNHETEWGKLSEDAYSNKKRSSVARRGAYREINKIMLRMFKWTNQLLFYADDVNILGGSVHSVKKNIETLVVASMDTGLEVNVKSLST